MSVVMVAVMTVVMSAMSVLMMTITVATCVVRPAVPVPAITITMPPVRGKRGWAKRQGSDQQSNSSSLDAIHGQSPLRLKTG